jgi:hypothetical protein
MLADLRYSLRTRWKRPWFTAATVLVLALAGATTLFAAAPTDRTSVSDVMRRVGAYVDGYGDKASIVVGTEHYTQETVGAAESKHHQRDIVADLGLVKVEAEKIWLGFRDVLEVDGRRVTDRDDRLATVLMAAGRFDEARRLNDESARYNIGPFERNFNVPTTALFFFKSANQARFKFAAKSVVAADGTWEIAFHEKDRPTMVRTPDGRSIPSEGTIWVDPTSGRIVHTVLRLDLIAFARGRSQNVHGSVDVVFRRVDALDMWLPATMVETFESRRGPGEWDRIDGHATYDNYRTFQTSARIK